MTLWGANWTELMESADDFKYGNYSGQFLDFLAKNEKKNCTKPVCFVSCMIKLECVAIIDEPSFPTATSSFSFPSGLWRTVACPSMMRKKSSPMGNTWEKRTEIVLQHGTHIRPVSHADSSVVKRKKAKEQEKNTATSRRTFLALLDDVGAVRKNWQRLQRIGHRKELPKLRQDREKNNI